MNVNYRDGIFTLKKQGNYTYHFVLDARPEITSSSYTLSVDPCAENLAYCLLEEVENIEANSTVNTTVNNSTNQTIVSPIPEIISVNQRGSV